jgi:ABC-type multidrug transport system fused ATPase/permease subunit
MKVGLVGATGSGKTSTVNLLPRLYPFEKGALLLDGAEIQSIARDCLRSQLGYVSQDVVVFGGTIRSNLVATLEGAPPSDAQLLAAAAKTGLDQVLRSCPDGLDHVVAEGGENLSMGERQLVAFTRMLLRDPAILILDEATANIDERCELLIQSAITEVMEGRTCFVIAHRLSTIIQCDLILVFKGGEIVEQGRHADLMALGGVYAGLATQQLGGLV